MGKTNGKDEAQDAEEQAPQRMVVAAVIAINPTNGALSLHPNDQVVKDRMAFLLAISQLALGNATTEHRKLSTSRILVPERKVARL